MEPRLKHDGKLGYRKQITGQRRWQDEEATTIT